MRKELYDIIEVSRDKRLSRVYDIFMLIVIVISVMPLTFTKDFDSTFSIVNIETTAIFALDYLLRLITADYKLGEKSFRSFLKYPFTPLAIVDLLSFVPTLLQILIPFNNAGLFKLLRTIRLFRALTTFKALRYSKSVLIIGRVIRNSADALLAVFSLAVAYILITALIIFNIETDSNDHKTPKTSSQKVETFFDAVYLSAVSLTTVGYGDIYPNSNWGKFFAMLSSFLGIAIVALPAGIITAGYMRALEEEETNKKEMRRRKKKKPDPEKIDRGTE